VAKQIFGWLAKTRDVVKKLTTTKLDKEAAPELNTGLLDTEYIEDVDDATLLEAYPKMLMDAAVKGAVNTALYEVCALDLNVTAFDPEDDASREQAEFVKSALTGVAGGPAKGLLLKMLEPALTIAQFSLSEIVWRVEKRGKYAGKWVLDKLKSKDVTDQKWGFKLDIYKNIESFKQTYDGAEHFYPKSKFLHYAHQALFENPRGVSLLKSAYRAWWVKKIAMRAWAVYVEKQGPVPVGRYDTEPEKDGLVAELKKFSARRWLAVPKTVELDIMNYGSATTRMEFESAIQELDKQIFLSIRGAFLQALEGEHTGARSMGEVHESTADLWVWYLALEVEGALNEQIVPQLITYNFGENVELPVVRLESPVQEDLKLQAEIDEKLWKMGYPLSVKEMQERYGRQVAIDEDDKLKKSPAVSPTPFGALPGDGTGEAPPLPEGEEEEEGEELMPELAQWMKEYTVAYEEAKANG